MGFFDFFRKKPAIQTLFDNFFRDMRIVDVIAASDIPMISLDGNEQRSSADIFFNKYAKYGPPCRINSFINDMDIIFWLFDTFCVLEFNASDDRAKQFVVLQHTGNRKNELEELVEAQASAFRMLQLKQAILEMGECFEMMLFKAACDFHAKHSKEAINIIKSKYY